MRGAQRRIGVPTGSIEKLRHAFTPASASGCSLKGCSMKRAISLFTAVCVIGCAVPATAQTLKAVKDRGSLICGVGQGVSGFSLPDDKGNWTGFDVDFC